MKFTNAIILAFSTQTTFSQAVHFRGTVSSNADFDTQRQQLVQYNSNCGTHPFYYGQVPQCPFPTVDTINVYNHCSEDIIVDGWGEIASGGQLAPAPQLQNPTTNPDTTDRIGCWCASAPENSDWQGFSIPVEMKAMKADHSPACVDSGFKTTYDPPAKQSDGSFNFKCPYGDDVKPGYTSSCDKNNVCPLCKPTDPNSPNMLLKSNSYVWNGCQLDQPGCDYGGEWSQTTYKSAINGGVNHNAAAQILSQ